MDAERTSAASAQRERREHRRLERDLVDRFVLGVDDAADGGRRAGREVNFQGSRRRLVRRARDDVYDIRRGQRELSGQLRLVALGVANVVEPLHQLRRRRARRLELNGRQMRAPAASAAEFGVDHPPVATHR
jgi:hypothetical protein